MPTPAVPIRISHGFCSLSDPVTDTANPTHVDTANASDIPICFNSGGMAVLDGTSSGIVFKFSTERWG